MNETIMQQRASTWLNLAIRCLKEMGMPTNIKSVEHFGSFDDISMLMLGVMNNETSVEDKTLLQDMLIFLRSMPTPPVAVGEIDFMFVAEQVKHYLPAAISEYETKKHSQPTGSMQFWQPDFMAIQDELLVIMKRSNEAKSVAEIDKCICDYKVLLGGIEDEAGGLKSIIQLRDAKAESRIVTSGVNIAVYDPQYKSLN
jgi:hypothetical protein